MSTKPRSFWSQGYAQYAALHSESRLRYLHPFLRDLAKSFRPRKVLDFGSGDGVLFEPSVSRLQELCLFDPSHSAIRLARKRFQTSSNVSFSTRASELAREHYDFAVCSLVLMAIPSLKGLRLAIRRLRQSVVPGGRCLVAVTHPCFRQYAFSSFVTEWVYGATFRYMNDGAKVRVRLTSGNENEAIEFDDYHWSLQTILTLFCEAGFTLRLVRELEDRVDEDGFANSSVPAYLVLLFQAANSAHL